MSALACDAQIPQIAIDPEGLPAADAIPVPTPTAAPTDERVGLFIEEAFYTIEGTDAQELLQAMRAHPDAPDSQQTRGDFFSATVWELQLVETSLLTGDGICTAGGLVNVTITTTYPQWEPGPETAPQLVARWEQFTSALREHEGGHIQIAINGAYALQAEVERLAAESTCAEFSSALREAHRRAVEQTSAAHALYDEQTGHGLTQNAVWPQAGPG